MNKIAIYGAGGFGLEVAYLIQKVNERFAIPEWEVIGFFDDGKKQGEINEYGPILGGIDELNAFHKPLYIAFGIRSPKIVKKIVSEINNENIYFPNIISPDCKYLDRNSITMGKGNILTSGCYFNYNIKVGDFNILDNNVSLGHDVIIGSNNSFMPGVRISDYVVIGSSNLFGVYSVVLKQKTIGNNTTIGAGSIIIRDTKDNNTYIGNPAIKFKF